jgi:hypothetical protein
MIITRQLTDTASASTASDIQLGSCVTEIGQGAFSGYTNITDVEFPESLTTIGVGAFSGSSITSVEFTSGVTTIGDNAFNRCSGLTELTIPSGITSIGDSAFNQCNKLERINMSGTTVPTLGSGAFDNTNSCTIYVPFDSYDDYMADNTWANYRSRIFYDGAPYKVRFATADEEKFVKCDGNTIASKTSNMLNGITSTTFGECVTDFADKAFQNTSLGDIFIPSNVKYINQMGSGRSYAFYGASATSITFSEGLEQIGYCSFEYFKCPQAITLPSTLSAMSNYAFASSTITGLTINGSPLLELNYYAFTGSSLNFINISNIKTVDGFRSCRNLETVTISNVENINGTFDSGNLKTVSITGSGSTTINGSFYNCGSLTSVTLGDCVKSIGSFYGCSSLPSITIPSGVTIIGDNCFGYCRSLETINLPSGITSIGSSAFQYCAIRNITLPNAIETISSNAFYNCGNLTNINIPSGVTTLNSLFNGCSSLSAVTGCENVSNIVSGAFQGVSALQNFTIPSGITVINDNTFSGCTSLRNVDIPSRVTSIGANAFTNCRSMTTLIIPNSVISIGNSAFSGCSGLNSILIGRATPPTIGTNVFAGSNCLIYVPQASYDLYVNAENWSLYKERIFATGMDYKAMLIGGTTKIIECNGNTTLAQSEVGTNNAETINIGNCVTAIGDSAFTSSNRIQTVSIPSGVTSVGNRAFYNRSTLTTVSGLKGVVTIGDYAFQYCGGLTSISFSDSLTSIGGFAFCGTSLTTIVVPSGVTEIKWGAFQSSALTSVTFEGLTPPTLVKNSQYSAPTNSYDSYYGLIRGKIPVYVPCAAYNDYLTAWASSDSAPITDCLVPYGQYEKDEEIVGEYLCDNGNKYKKMGHYVSSDNINWCLTGYINGDLIEADASDCQVYLHMELSSSCGNNCDKTGYTYTKYCGEATSTTVTEDDYPYRWRSDTANITYVTAVTIGNCATAIGDEAFNDCDNLQIVNISSSITSIGYSAFSNTRIKNLEIQNGVTSIGDKAFRMCPLTALTIPSSVVSIGDEAFYQTNANTLTSITINATTPPTIGTNVFSGSSCFIYVPCESVASYKNAWSMYADRIKGIQPCQEEIKVRANYSDGSDYTTTCGGSTILSSNSVPSVSSVVSAVVGDCVTEINGTFNFASSLSSITLGNSVTTLGAHAIRGTKITSITLPNTLTTIGESALENNSRLTSVVIPSGVTSIGTAAFGDCTSLTSIVIPDSVTSISYNAFQNCTSLTSCTIGNGVTSIGGSAFYNCRSLKNITIGNSIASIGGSAFNYCNGLESITINATTPPSINYDTLYNTNNCVIYVPSGSVDAYKGATNWSNLADRIQAIPNS